MSLNPETIVIAVDGEVTKRQDICDAIRCSESIGKVFTEQGFKVNNFYLTKKDFSAKDKLLRRLKACKPLCVFNLFEGFSDESSKEAEFAEFLEKTGFLFTGNSALALALSLDKSKIKQVFRRHHILVPRGITVKRLKDINCQKLRFPVFIKPSLEDASIGIDEDSLVARPEELVRRVQGKLQQFPAGLIIEEFIAGKEYSLGFLGNFSDAELLAISVIDYRQYHDFLPFLTYQAKWDQYSREFSMVTPEICEKLPTQLENRLRQLALKAARIAKCRSYFRIDLREQGGNLFILDINPNPDINTNSGFMKQAYYKGYTYSEVVGKILTYALLNRAKKI